MRYRVRGPLHTDISQIGTELRGFIAHTGTIRLDYLQMHGMVAHTIQVSDAGAEFFTETVMPKLGAAGCFVPQDMPLRRPKELRLAVQLCPTTATSLPNLGEWAGVWAQVVFSPRRPAVYLRCLPDDAGRLRGLEQVGWRVLPFPRSLAPAPIVALLVKRASPFAPQFWPARTDTAAPALVASTAPVTNTAAPAAPTALFGAAEVLAAPDRPHVLLGVTPRGQGVRLARRAMIISVPEGAERQESVVTAMLLRALSQDMGALVVAERAKVSPRALAPMMDKLRLIDMANPWESASIPWRNLPPEALKRILGAPAPSPMPTTLGEALAAVGRRNLATPVLEAITREPAFDLAGTLESGGAVVLLLEPGSSASLIAALLILHLSLTPAKRPLMICRPALLPMPPALANRAVQFVFGETPTVTFHLQAAPDSWVARFPDGQSLVLQENLAAPVDEQVGADHDALMNGLQGRGWTPAEAESLAQAAATSTAEQRQGESWHDDAAGLEGLGWPDEPTTGGLESLGWPESLDAPADGVLLHQDAAEAPDTGLADLVAAWYRGESMTCLARALRERRPDLSLITAMQTLKAAIHDGSTAAATQPPTPSVSAASPVTVSENAHLLNLLRQLALHEPDSPLERDALRRWFGGERRAAIVRDMQAAGVKESEARATFDRLVLPRVISDLNGNAESVLAFFQVPSDDQAELPPVILDCISRLLGLPKAHARLARPMLPGLREVLTALDTEGRA